MPSTFFPKHPAAILLLAGDEHKYSGLKLPSWCPDWSWRDDDFFAELADLDTRPPCFVKGEVVSFWPPCESQIYDRRTVPPCIVLGTAIDCCPVWAGLVQILEFRGTYFGFSCLSDGFIVHEPPQ
jgi:hypothetical protein